MTRDLAHVEHVVARLRAAGCVFAEDEADALLDEAAGDDDRLAALLARRIAGEPLELVLGWAGFAGLRIATEPTVFVPRRRTEALVAEALRAVDEGVVRPADGAAPVVVDLCCGTGAVGAAIAAGLVARGRGIELVAADLDPAAVRAAHRNLDALGARVVEGDLFAALPIDLRARVDVLAVNAPYVPTDAIATMPPEARDHEARIALDGGADGLDVHRRVAAAAREWLRPGGVVLIETSERQAPGTSALLAAAGLDTRIAHDDEVDGTVAIGVAPR